MAKTKKDSLLSLPYVHPKGGKPYVRLNYFDQRAGRWKSKEKRVDTVEEAIAAYEELKKKVGARPTEYDPDKITFDQLLAEYKKAKQPPDWAMAIFEDYFGKRKIKSITYADLAEFRRAREAVVSGITKRARKPATINREMMWLRAVFFYAVRHDWLEKDPFKKGAEPLIRLSEEEARDRIPSPDEEAAILEQCVGRRARLRPILIGLKDTGLRRGALLSLTWSAVGIRQGDSGPEVGDFLYIPKGKANKGRPRVIAMTARLRAEIVSLWEQSDKKPESLIFGEVGDFRTAYRSACRFAGVTGLRVHDWRHGHATDMMEGGVEERIAMRASGHKNAETHARYTNIDERIAKMIAESLDRLHADRERQRAAKQAVSDRTGHIN